VLFSNPHALNIHHVELEHLQAIMKD